MFDAFQTTLLLAWVAAMLLLTVGPLLLDRVPRRHRPTPMPFRDHSHDNDPATTDDPATDEEPLP